MNGRDLSEVRALIRRFALSAFNALSSGLIVKTGAGTYAARTITSADASLTVTNGDGVSGNIDLSVAPTVLLGSITTTSGSSQSLSSLTLTPYRFLRLTFAGVGTDNAAWVLRVDGVQVSGTFNAAAVLRGIMDIDLTNGVFSAAITNAAANASAVATAYSGDTDITTATTTVTVSTSAGSFDNGSLRVYGIR